jgi:hypothetical protein
VVEFMNFKHTTFISAVAVATFCVFAGARADNMRDRVAEIRRQIDAQAARPEAERWADDEAHVMELEGKAESGGDMHAAAYLKLARERLAKLRRQRIMTLWGAALDEPEGTLELRVHAQRAARLKRVRALAIAKKYPNLAEQAGKLLEAERLRHESAMQALSLKHEPAAESAEARVTP